MINYIILIGLILFFVLLVWSYYSNEPVMEGLLISQLQDEEDQLNKLIQKKQQLETDLQTLRKSYDIAVYSEPVDYFN